MQENSATSTAGVISAEPKVEFFNRSTSFVVPVAHVVFTFVITLLVW